jgi:hypothetical protein
MSSLIATGRDRSGIVAASSRGLSSLMALMIARTKQRTALVPMASWCLTSAGRGYGLTGEKIS